MNRLFLATTLGLTLLAGCAGESRRAPVSTDVVGSGSQMPEPANSLPRGSAVDAPLTPVQGDLATTRVGPGRTAR